MHHSSFGPSLVVSLSAWALADTQTSQGTHNNRMMSSSTTSMTLGSGTTESTTMELPGISVSASVVMGGEEVHEQTRLEVPPDEAAGRGVGDGVRGERGSWDMGSRRWMRQAGQQLSMNLRVNDTIHSRVIVHQIKCKPAGYLRQGLSGRDPEQGRIAPNSGEEDGWCWDKPFLTLTTDDIVCWHWTRGPMNIIATDSHFCPLSPAHPRAFTSGPAAGNGTFEWRFHLPGTYYYGCLAITDDRYALRYQGKILVQSEWQRFWHDLIHKNREMVSLSLGLWIILAIVLEAIRRLVLVPYYEEAARQLPPLTAMVLTQLLPAALSWVTTPASLSLMLFLVSPAVWLVRSFRKHRFTAFGRGYIRRVHWKMRSVMVVCVLALVALILLGWLSIIKTCGHIGEMASGLSKAVLSNVDYLQMMILEGNLLLDTFKQEGTLSDSILDLLLQSGIDVLQVLSDGSVLTDGVQLLVAEATALFASFQQAFLGVNFLFLQLASVTSALGASAAMRSNASQARAMGWLATFTLAIFFLLVSINGAAAVVLQRLPFHLRQQAASTNKSANAMGLDAETQILPLVAQLYDYCGGGAWSNEGSPLADGSMTADQVEVVFNAAGVLAREVNAILGKQVVIVEESPWERGNLTFQRVHTLLESIAWELSFIRNHANISDLVSLAEQHGVPLVAGADAIEEEGEMSVLYLTLTMLQKVITFLQCKTVGPHVANTVERYQQLVSMMWELLSLNLAFSVLLAILVALSGISAHVLDRPHKYYYYVHSGRWFRFLPAYRAHKTCWKRLHDSIDSTQRRLEESTRTSERNEAREAALQHQQRAERNLFYHPPGLSCRAVLQAVSQMYSTLLLWLIL